MNLFSSLIYVLVSVQCFTFLFSATYAAETPETILVRKTLSTDLSGLRRSDMELVLSAYDNNFVSYEAKNSSNPSNWLISLESYEELSNDIQKKLKKNRYELDRTVSSIKVRGIVATATSVDSGNVIDRNSGEWHAVNSSSFWTLLKREDKWHITSVVQNLGTREDEKPKSENYNDIEEILQEAAEAREASNVDVLEKLFSEHFIGYDANHQFDPRSWKMIFGGSEEFIKHLKNRLPNVNYDIERTVLSTHVGPNENEATAMTYETVSVQHNKGNVQHKLERNVMWTFKKKDSDWQITTMVYNCGPLE